MALVDTKQIRNERRSIAGVEIPVAVVPVLPHHGTASRFFSGLYGLLTGMKLTLSYFLNPFTILTRQYPNNRATLRFPDRYRAVLKFKHVTVRQPVVDWKFPDEKSPKLRLPASLLRDWTRGYEDASYHKCTGCKNCEAACPNASIRVVTRIGELTDDREVDRFIWRMDSCMYCNACVQACPFDAIEMGPDFENAVYDRRLLVYNLNRQAGPPASLVTEEEDIDVRRKMMSHREICGGPIPLNGHPLPNLRPLPVTPVVDASPGGAGPRPESAT
ncbi:MAG: 4Fe-4S binding protein [Candidatus Hydrogenedentales bacterium]|jgi:NADH-quinone oxidoreductase subunit I